MKNHKNGSLHGSISNAVQGIRWALKTERNLRIHIVVCILVMMAGLFFKIELIEWIILFLVIAFVFIAELFNTAIEFTVDLANPSHNIQAKIAKDIAAAAVLISSLLSIIVGILTFGPRIAGFFA